MQPFRSILVDIDATARAQPALERAVRIARGCGARLKIVDVVSVPFEARSYLRADLEQDVANCRRQQLARIAHGIAGVAVDSNVLLGEPARALIQEVLRSGHDLLVRSHARDVVARGPKPFGAVDTQLFRKCPCPVWAVGPGPVPQYPKIVGAVHASPDDASEHEMNVKIIELALFIADLERGSLVLLQAWRPFGEHGILSHTSDEEFSAYVHAVERRSAESLTQLKASFGGYLAGVQADLHRGEAEEVIPEFVVAQGIDLVVLGTVARTGIAGLLIGNTAERLLRKLPCSVLAVKPDGFVSPVRLEEPA
jgi:universal stress protein E